MQKRFCPIFQLTAEYLPAGGALDKPGVPLDSPGQPAVPGEVVGQQGTPGGQSVSTPAGVSEGANPGQVGSVVQTVDGPGLLGSLNLVTAAHRVVSVLPLQVISIDAVLQNVAKTK